MAVWYVWLAYAILNLVDLAVRGHDHTAAVIAGVVLFTTGVAYLAALRPRILADDQALTLRNPFRDIRVPWGTVTSIDLKDLVRVHCRIEAGAGEHAQERVLRGWALQSTYRGRLRAQRRTQAEAAERAGYGRWPPRTVPIRPMPSADRAVARLNELRADASERGAAAGPLAVTWSWVSAAALAVPAAIVVALILIP